jgi:hypothetical protein
MSKKKKKKKDHPPYISIFINFRLLTLSISSALIFFFYQVIYSMPSSSREIPFNMEYLQSQNFMFTRKLKTVVVRLFNRENEIKLIKYLLTNAQELN